ncbi:hypothetical protein PN462_21090 [Spirulina sp. CS-785/01]|uniref:hypothetical protein n=1 Tax=Spirulina sp. CS-785/01 TaxID=3021716 RepID=UPI00232AAA6E|nr:hypothetical protein [Spirulina sp. CS-785/01]MDB9315622.1 hypothetical protein [Spirulina sp. CS-785/01]
MKLTETLVAAVIVTILASFGYNSLIRFVNKTQLKGSLVTISQTARMSRYNAVETTPKTLCFRQRQQVEFTTISGNDCETAIGWRSLAEDIKIDTEHTTLRTVRGVAGYGGSDIYRMSWAKTKAGLGASWGQLGKIVLRSGQQRGCFVLSSIQGDTDIRFGKQCHRS